MLRAQRLLVALLMVLAVVVPALAAKPSKVAHSSSKTAVALWVSGGGVSTSPTDNTKKTKPDASDTDQSEGEEDSSSSSSSSGGQVLEEEHHKVVYLIHHAVQPNHGLGFWSERVDRDFEAWFYTTSHPPLTPPPNVA